MSTLKAGSDKVKFLLLCGWAAVAISGSAVAEETSPLSANTGVVSDYVFRGISQTSGNPAIQGGVDYAHGSGLYIGLWASNVNWITALGATGTANLELDTYAGFRNTLNNGFNYDLGLVRYNYPGSYTSAAGYTKADTSEAYFGIGYKWGGVKYSYGLGNFLTVPGARGTDYIEVNVNAPLGESGINLVAHAGRQVYRGVAADALAAAGTTATYSDWKLGVSKEISGINVGLAYTGTDARAGGFYTTPAGKNLARSTVVLSATKTF